MSKILKEDIFEWKNTSGSHRLLCKIQKGGTSCELFAKEFPEVPRIVQPIATVAAHQT